jgi:hypothetical protein
VRILLDNCVHYGAKGIFPGHEVLHARDVGWRDLSNGDLLARAAQRFELFVTTDKNIRFEQNLETLSISILELNTKFTRIQDLKLLAPFLLAAIERSNNYRFVSVSPDGKIETLAERK